MATLLSCRRHWPLLMLLVFCTGISAGVAGDRPEFTYRASANEVRLTFSATDQNDHGVATLQPSDFAVVDKGFIVRNFESFSRSDWTKIDVALLLDSSQSVAPHFNQEVAGILEIMTQTSGIPDENLSMFSFKAQNPALLCFGDCRASHASEGLPARPSGSMTPLFDTVVFSSDFLAHHGDADAEKVLILFSDGLDTISRNSLGDAIDVATMSEVQIYAIDLNPSSTYSAGTAVLRKLAGKTGGRYFAARDGTAAALNALLEDFKASYTISYQIPGHIPGFHEVWILPTQNRNLQFRSRSGYYYPNHIR
jgi:VWFA-related protein